MRELLVAGKSRFKGGSGLDTALVSQNVCFTVQVVSRYPLAFLRVFSRSILAARLNSVCFTVQNLIPSLPPLSGSARPDEGLRPRSVCFTVQSPKPCCRKCAKRCVLPLKKFLVASSLGPRAAAGRRARRLSKVSCFTVFSRA